MKIRKCKFKNISVTTLRAVLKQSYINLTDDDTNNMDELTKLSGAAAARAAVAIAAASPR